MSYFVELSVNGAIAGSLYALIALAFVVIYKASRIINFALGEWVMFGTSFVAVGLHLLAAPLIVSIGLACVGMYAVAVIFNCMVLRPLAGGRAIALIMVTIGFGAFLRAVAAMVFAGVPRHIELPIPAGTVEVAGVLLSLDELAVAAIAIALIGAVSYCFARSRWGIALRALADDRGAAMAMGIDVQWCFAFVWGLAGAIAVVGGVLWTGVAGGGFGMVLVGLKIFPVAIIGGLDSIRGALVGAMLIGWLESLTSGYLGGGVSSVAAYAVLLAFLLVRPYGVFGRADIERV
ncbi:MAG: branched-chain amino acid ABC transporter permease [Gammaproteobacteria bacterium]|nr:branched-chain amino acid ABC transporter permease [Gammaproteobacteria bacterium]